MKKKTITDYKRENELHLAIIKTQRQEMDKLLSVVNQLNSTINAKHHEIDDLNNSINSYDDAIKRLTEANTQWQKIAEERLDKSLGLQESRRETSQWRDAYDDQCVRITDLKNKHTQQDKEYKEIYEDNCVKAKTIAELHTHVRMANDTAKNWEKSYIQVKDEITELKAKEVSKEAMENVYSTIDQLNNVITNKNAVIDQKINIIDSQHEEIKRLKEAHDAQKINIRVLTDKLKQQNNNQYQSAKSSYELLKELNRLREIVSTSKQLQLLINNYNENNDENNEVKSDE